MINVFILNWNSSDDVSLCASALLRSTHNLFRLIIIDNGSDKFNLECLNRVYIECKSRHNETYLVLNNSNLGYAGGNNLGFKFLKNNFLEGDVLIINPDIVVSDNTLEIMCSVLESDSSISGCMVRTLSSEGVIVYDYIRLLGFKQRWLVSDCDLAQTDYLAGSCMLLRRSVLDVIGLFNVDFFMYWEEVDLSLRMREHGFKLVSTNRTIVSRRDNSPSRSLNSVYYLVRNVFLLSLLHVNFTKISLIKYLSRFLFINVLRCIKYKNVDYIVKYYLGFRDGLLLYIKQRYR